MQIIPIMPIETMYGMVNRRAGYYIRRSPTGKLYTVVPTVPVMSRHLPNPPISSVSPPATPAAINTRPDRSRLKAMSSHFLSAMYVMKHLFKKNQRKICSCRIFFVTLQPNREKPIESML